MDFYTNVTVFGNAVLVRGIKNGERITTRHKFKPTLFVPVKKQTNFKTLDNKSVTPVVQESIKEAKEFVDQYKTQPGMVYGFTRWPYQWISDTFRGEIKWDMNKIMVATMDIETESEHGFPQVDNPIERVLSVTLKNHQSKKFVVFGLHGYQTDREDVSYIKCENEDELLRKFLNFWEINMPDVLTGWNTRFFDIPYLVNRIKVRLGGDEVKRLSPWKAVFDDDVFKMGRKHTAYDIIGVSQLDYLDLYQKYTYSAQESYTLDHIGFIELGKAKKKNPYETFRDWYTKDFQSFIDYNIQDVEIVDALEDKMKLIDLQITMAYFTKCNYNDVYSQVKMWDVIIYNYLRDKGIQIPLVIRQEKSEAYAGAYVKDPQVGLHEWVVSFDLNSLYPHLIMQYNISPETIVGMTETHPGVDAMLDKSYDTEFLQDINQTMTPNGALFSRKKHGFLPELMQKMYNDRKVTKKQMLEASQKYEETKDIKYKNIIPKLNNRQMALKIALNSAYGAVGNQYFRFFDIRIAEAVTYGGQLSIRWIENALNGYFNEILETEGEDYVLASDTDSVYITFEKLIEKLKPKDPVKFLDTICQEKIEPWIDDKYAELAEYVNAYEQKMVMAREVIADKGIWTAKKRYILNVHNSEGVQYAEPKLKMMGIEAVKSSTPQVCRDKIRDALKLIMSGDEKDLNDFIQDFRKEWMEMSPTAIAFPRSCNGMGKWGDPNGIFKKGTPMHVKGALVYNYQLKVKKLAKKYPMIQNGEKIKFVHLKDPNPYQCNAFTFVSDCPEELEISKYIDYEKQFEKSYVEPLKFITNAIQWQIDESYGTQATLMDFFS
tara:strand:+ start:535 stop:3021 length:2487 start_codon:yes stop_codon:yes gene_type:complete